MSGFIAGAELVQKGRGGACCCSGVLGLTAQVGGSATEGVCGFDR